MNDHRFQERIRNELLLEVLEEEIVEILSEVAVEVDEPLSDYNKEAKWQKTMDITARSLAERILNEVLMEEFVTIGSACFDDIIETHHRNLDSVRKLNFTLQDVTREMIEEIVLDVVDMKTSKKQREGILESILNEVIAEDSAIIGDKVLNHYRARVALLQYRQMQDSASNMVLDTFLLEALLTQHQSEEPTSSKAAFGGTEHNMILDEVLLEIVLSQSLALHSCFHKIKPKSSGKNSLSSAVPPRECVPLKWYKKKITSAIAEDVVVTLLAHRLDESMQFAEDEQLKDQAISLFHRYLDVNE